MMLRNGAASAGSRNANADGETIFYLECNDLFDDANGTLSSDITSDGIHPDGSAYRKWGEWVKQNAIVK